MSDRHVPSNLVTLLPCPFCAGEVEVAFYHPDMGPSSCYVKCWCGARGTEHQYHHGDSKEAIAKAHASWNRRSSGETSEESDPCVSHLAMREYEKALDTLWNLLDGTDEDARTGDVTIESADWQRWLVVFWNLGDGYRERLANLGWSPPKTSAGEMPPHAGYGCGPDTPWDLLCHEPSCAYCGAARIPKEPQ